MAPTDLTSFALTQIYYAFSLTEDTNSLKVQIEPRSHVQSIVEEIVLTLQGIELMTCDTQAYVVMT